MENSVLSKIVTSFIEIIPSSFILNLSTINPVGSTIAEIPLLADLKVYFPYSTDLKILCVKCWYGPIDPPNQPSSDMFTIKSYLLFLDSSPE